jgi:hypothetical protein
MGIEKNVFEWRRFGHWDTGAKKARLSAYALWTLCDQTSHAALATQCNHQGDDVALALHEAFRRESAIALELVIKAVIARKLRDRAADPALEGVRVTHDVPKLWLEAGLPTLAREDLYRLYLAKQVLIWSGRYSTPSSVKAWEKETLEFRGLEDPATSGQRFKASTPIVLGWSDFDRLFQIAFSFLK